MSDVTPTPTTESAYREQTWETFREAGMLWFTNRILHVFGWAIVVERGDGFERVYAARTSYRGFSPEIEARGFINVTEHMQRTVGELRKELDE